jgi:RimJ/RimL family protein N-acetyltransferase
VTIVLAATTSAIRKLKSRIVLMNDSPPLFKTDDAFVRLLIASDGDNLQKLCEQCSDYFELMQGYPADSSESHSLFRSLPEGKEYADKYLLGIFSKFTGRLIGVIDLIRDFPASGEWMLGLMLLNPESRALGIGGRICQFLVYWCQSNGAKSIRIGVVEDNAAALHFWQKMGFEEHERRPFQRYGSKDHTIIVLRHYPRAAIPNIY